LAEDLAKGVAKDLADEPTAAPADGTGDPQNGQQGSSVEIKKAVAIV
jgi:hypothetical protein